jgi:hypothetical protein
MGQSGKDYLVPQGRDRRPTGIVSLYLRKTDPDPECNNRPTFS